MAGRLGMLSRAAHEMTLFALALEMRSRLDARERCAPSAIKSGKRESSSGSSNATLTAQTFIVGSYQSLMIFLSPTCRRL